MKYTTPEMKIIAFEAMDVITTSGDLEEDELPPVIIPQTQTTAVDPTAV